MDIVFAASFIQLFSYKDQVEVCKMIARLLKEKKGSMLFGRQVGSLKSGWTEKDRKTTMYRHNEETFRRMWKEVEEATGTR
jgi:hypothetical protein